MSDSEPELPYMLVFPHLESEGCVPKSHLDIEFIWSVERITNPHDEVMKHLQATQSRFVFNSQPNIEDLPRESVVSHIESNDYIVFDADGTKETHIKGVKDVMEKIVAYIQNNKSMETMSIVWMEVKDMPSVRAIYSIEQA